MLRVLHPPEQEISDGREKNRHRHEGCLPHRENRRLRRRSYDLGRNTNATELNSCAGPKGTTAQAVSSYAPVDYRIAAASSCNCVRESMTAKGASSYAELESMTSRAVSNYARAAWRCAAVNSCAPEECRIVAASSCAPEAYRTESAASSCARVACTNGRRTNSADDCRCTSAARSARRRLNTYHCLWSRRHERTAGDRSEPHARIAES
jgi:hypothetical protein